MSHKFDPSHFHKLENPERYQELPPLKTLLQLGAKKGMNCLDIGAGTGFFTFALAEIVGESSTVYASDISEIMLNEIKRKAEEKMINSIVPVLSQETEIGMQEKVDFINIAFVMHEFNNPLEYMQKVFNQLLLGGKLAILEWKKKETPKGPPLHHRLSEVECVEILTKVGFQQLEILDLHENFYAIKATK